MRFPDWTREPLVHFLLAGFVLFVALTWASGGNVDPASRIITVDADRKVQVALQFERTMGRAPTDAELDAAIERFVRDEVLYREALRLGLDQGDAVVRRRLVTKMDLSASAAAEAAEPDEAALRSFFDANTARYAATSAVSFDQVFFADESAARAALAGLDTRSDWKQAGESISLPASVDGLARQELVTRFGAQFAGDLEGLKAGEAWQGPLRSGFGWHLVRLRERGGGEAKAFEDVREQVANDWRAAEIAARKERAFEVLREGYRVEIAE
ncbi:MAG: peptidylprolyl isomerase [Pseudomonadota bacterium]